MIKCNNDFDMYFLINHWLETLTKELEELLKLNNWTSLAEYRILDKKIALIVNIVSHSISSTT